MSAKLRVLCVGHSYVLAVNRSIARSLAMLDDYEVTVVAPNFFHGDLRDHRLEPEPKDSRLKVIGVDCTATRFIHVFYYDLGPIRKLWAEGRFDVIYIWEEPFLLAGWQLARMARKWKVPYCFVSFQNIDKRYIPPFCWFEKQVVSGMAGWTTGGKLVYDLLSKRGYDSAKGVLIPMAVDTALFQAAPEGLGAIEKDPNRPVIGYMGRLVPEKGIGVILKALELLPANSWAMLFLGGGPEEKTILEWAQQRGWMDRIKVVLAKHHEVPSYLKQMDLLLAPSLTTPRWKEQFGRMIIEAFACGIPVIASDSGEIPYVVGDAGIIVPEGDADALAEQIVRLLHNEGLRKDLIAKGLSRSVEFGSEALALKQGAFFREVASRGPTV